MNRKLQHSTTGLVGEIIKVAHDQATWRTHSMRLRKKVQCVHSSRPCSKIFAHGGSRTSHWALSRHLPSPEKLLEGGRVDFSAASLMREVLALMPTPVFALTECVHMSVNAA